MISLFKLFLLDSFLFVFCCFPFDSLLRLLSFLYSHKPSSVPSQVLTLFLICVDVFYPLPSILSACGHKYCLECDPVDGACLQCRDGTLLNESAGSTGEFCPGNQIYMYTSVIRQTWMHEVPCTFGTRYMNLLNHPQKCSWRQRSPTACSYLLPIFPFVGHCF